MRLERPDRRLLSFSVGQVRRPSLRRVGIGAAAIAASATALLGCSSAPATHSASGATTTTAGSTGGSHGTHHHGSSGSTTTTTSSGLDSQQNASTTTPGHPTPTSPTGKTTTTTAPKVINAPSDAAVTSCTKSRGYWHVTGVVTNHFRHTYHFTVVAGFVVGTQTLMVRELETGPVDPGKSMGWGATGLQSSQTGVTCDVVHVTAS